MKFNKLSFIILISLVLLMASQVSAGEPGMNETADSQDGVILGAGDSSIYVDDYDGNDLNDGRTHDTSVKSLSRALDLAEENATIYIASGNYSSTGNARLTIDKSVSIVGTDGTTFDGLGRDYFFTVSDGVAVTFRNLNFVNAYKVPKETESVYGAVLDIRDAKVTLDNCLFINNIVNDNTNSPVYGGAISNFGDLTILNSYFNNNSVSLTATSQGMRSQGGAIYNNGRVSIKNSSFYNSKCGVFSYGATIANNGELDIDNSVIAYAYGASYSYGSAIYNNGDLNLTNSLIKNNIIDASSCPKIFGVIYNVGNFTGSGNLFLNNSMVHGSTQGVFNGGSPTIFNIANLNLTYNAFIDNQYYDGAVCDVFVNSGSGCIVSLDNNWWNTNESPLIKSHTNHNVSSWLTFTLTPTYTPLNISDSVIIRAEWKSTIGNEQIGLFPVLNVTFETSGIVQTREMINGNAEFDFIYTQEKGLYDVTANVYSFNQSVEVDVGKLVSTLTFNVTDNIEYFDTLKINVTVLGNGALTPTGQVLLKLAGRDYYIDLTNGRGHLEISDLNPDRYNLTFTYLGNGEYFKDFANTTVTVKKQPVDLNLTIPSIKIDEKQTQAIVSLNTKGAQGQAVLYLNGVRKQVVYLYNGETTITLKNLAEGEYNATLVFVGNNQYESANVSTVFRVSKYSTVLNIYASDINVGENETILIEALPEELRGEATLSLNGANNTIWINNTNTTVNISGLGPGLYEVSIIYLGDSRYYGANDTASFRVIRPESSLAVDIIKDDDSLNGTVTVKTDPSNCTGLVGVYINYRFYSMDLTDGSAVFNVEFDQGTNYVFIYYEGDDMHEGATWNTTLGVADNFTFIGENSTAFEHNDFSYSVRLIEVTGIPMPNRNVTVRFMGRTYGIITDDDGFAYLPLNLEAGTYTIEATYEGKTIKNTLTVRQITFEIRADDTNYGDVQTIVVSTDENLTGGFNINISGILDVSVEIAKGNAEYNVTGLKPGKYTVNVKYVNAYFNSTQKSGDFTVRKAELNVSVDFNQREFTITVYNLKNATGNLTLEIDGTEYEIPINDSKAVLTRNLTEGRHALKITYAGDGNYSPFTLDTAVNVKSSKTDVVLTIDDGIYGENLTVTANVDRDATGTIEFEVENITGSAEIKNGIAAWTFSGLDAGNYTVNAHYGGDSDYLDSGNSTSFEVTRADSDILVYVNEAVLDENIRIYANLTDGATGSVLFAMDGYYSPRYKNVRNSQAQWYISPLSTGSYRVFASYIGDNNFKPSNATYILNISQKRSVLEVSIDDAREIDRITAYVKLTNSSGSPLDGTVTLTLGSKTYDVSVSDGKATLVIGKMNAGNYTYSAVFAGNDEYAKSSLTGTFEVIDSLLNVTITSNNLTKYYKGSKKLEILVRTTSGKAVSDVALYVTLEGGEYEIRTDADGHADMDVDLPTGNYTAQITLREDDFYHEANANASISIYATVAGIDLIKLYGSSNQYFAIFSDSEGNVLANTEVKFTIESESYTTKTLPNGVVKLNINLNPGNYTITAINPVTDEKAVNYIYVYAYLTENSDITQYYGANKVYKVRAFDKNGSVAAGVTVKIKVKGKTYKVKTDRNGYAKRKIGLVPGIYNITATYNGYTVINRITVKPVLSVEDISIRGSKIKFKVKLLNGKGKIAKKTKVTFKFKGKKYKAKTNRKGIATLKVNKYLKVGKHKITAYYKKSKITQIINVR